MTSRELWCEGEVPFLANETAWRIENAAGELKAQGEQLTIGTNRIVHSPEVNFVALGIQPGDRLILPEWDSRWWQIGGEMGEMVAPQRHRSMDAMTKAVT